MRVTQRRWNSGHRRLPPDHLSSVPSTLMSRTKAGGARKQDTYWNRSFSATSLCLHQDAIKGPVIGALQPTTKGESPAFVFDFWIFFLSFYKGRRIN